MAGDWIKMRTNLSSDPAVIQASRLLDCSEFKVVGLLHWIWSWADTHTEDGNAVGIDCKWINKQTDTEGLCEALVTVGWLKITDNGISIPNFASHNGASAKSRANTARRAANYTARKKIEPPLPNGEETEVRTNKTQKTEPKVTPLDKLLQAQYAYLLEGEKREDLMAWLEHLKQRLPKPYTDPGARAFLRRVDEYTPEELARGVAHSLEGNYLKLCVPKETNYGSNYKRNNQSNNKPKWAEFDD